MWIRSSLKALAAFAFLLLSCPGYTVGVQPEGISSGLAVGADGINNGSSVGVTPPSCSNSLDFTAACNSQYIGVI